MLVCLLQPRQLLVGDLIQWCTISVPVKIVRSCTSFYTIVILFFTIVVSSSPVDLKEQVTDDNRVILTWKPPNYPNGVITGYQIIYNGHKRSSQVILKKI